MPPRSIAIIGKSGSGKDTQVKLLAHKLQPNLIISTGKKLREIAEFDTLLGRRTREDLEQGKLFPAWFASYLWKQEFVSKLKGDEHILMGSSPRRLEEAEELDRVLEWLTRSLAEAVYLEISDDEAVERLLKRGRHDDDEKTIRQRLSWFTQDIEPTIAYYEQNGRLHRVDGVGSIEDVANRIARALGVL